ncbi:rod shape-determining protein RodA [Thiohalophilus sp.]|uniref:rod shape-determining protein RodA n=1 Tax=Thiohalophilus sp. TaxID=3028392 RepID=UPI002ACDACBE|nr:rod shape-determining protein RodA [Thiohalophilus sp.]MDZ7662031.1 rod shape-determining protein RodA [Thiohalophilus sp.]
MSPTDQHQFANENRTSAGRQILQRLHLDLPLLLALLILAVIGGFVLYSASDRDTELLVRHALRFLIGFVIMVSLAQLQPETIRFWSPWLFSIGLILLFAVLLFGQSGGGAQRWLNFGLFRFQPSEIMKIAVPMMIAWYLCTAAIPPTPGRLLISVLLLVVPTLLIARQPDLGTALLIACAGFFVLFLAGLRWRLMIGALIALIASTPLIWNYLLHDYQRQRVLTFLNPEIEPLGSGYHIIQSTIAIGSGGIYGKGWLNGTQAHLDFLPERSTDFIFAVFSEEFGLLGVLVLLLLYGILITRGIIIAARAQDTYNRLLAGSLILTFFIYVLINIGMVSGLLPVVGVPLPLISYGGTSIVTLLAGFGILMSIQTHRRLIST